MFRALLIVVAGAATAGVLAAPASAEPTPMPCSDKCVYQQYSDDEDESDEEEWDEGEWAGPEDWVSPMEDVGLYPNLELCGGVDTAIPFIGTYGCVPIVG